MTNKMLRTIELIYNIFKHRNEKQYIVYVIFYNHKKSNITDY